MKNEATGLQRLVNATRFSWQGFKAAYKSEEAFRQEVWLAILLLPLGLWLGDGAVERILLCGSVLLLMMVELLNSAVECVVDRFGPEWNKYSGRAKDMGSAAVFLAIALMLLTWALILLT
ncbi:MAG TPA: diacylglycerol kinase [Gammaproteobacteria bacterium]|jgi:diacylglycerol kinase (ATP)|nr:diacylglycerol kinase [Gammaproteobacteria bacterium]